jgi:XTP/dITP diphosphohydrolase
VREIVLATNNPHKIMEMSTLLQSRLIILKSLNDYPPFPPAEETGSTFEENAVLKARKAALHLKLPCLADDSGLQVDALDGSPGIFSARFAPTNPERIERLLRELKDIPQHKRSARFVCSLAAVKPNGDTITKTGYCHGYIADKPRGTHGFGYDPVFFLPELGKTMAELAPEEKNRISHRANAARLLLPIIEHWIKSGDPF